MTPNDSIDSGISVKRYPGEDTRLTSKKELAGCYLENGVLLSDRTTPCGDSTKKQKGSPDDGQCIVTVLGIDINTASFAMYTFSISVLLQALLVVSISCAADHGNYRKRLLLIFAWTGSVSVMAYIFVFKDIYLLGALLAIVSNTAFGASFVLLNSFLPLLVRHHPRVKEQAAAVVVLHEPQEAHEYSRYSEESSNLAEHERRDSDAPLLSQANGDAESLHLQRTPTHEELTSVELQLSTQISAKGIDAVATTSSTAILFAKTQLGMKPWALGLINVISTTTGVMGAFSWSFISRHFSLKPHQTILSIIAVFEIIPIYGLLGYLPFVRRWEVFGLQQPWEMYPLAAVYGFVLGGLGSYCRSLYGELIPPGSEAAFYALYAITDKGSSVFGPTIVGAIIDASGEIRPAFWFLAVLVGLPAPIIYFIDLERGKFEGEKLAEVIEGYKSRENIAEAGDEGSHHVSESQGILTAYDGDNEDNSEHRETR
ncbi:Autophagy protein 22 [Diatrype stigma]|uniref:Autophagy-related protein n=1 Tax=Diatrype stigma TaxID=117547 RepID=A0AAN9YJS1_9PEZI